MKKLIFISLVLIGFCSQGSAQQNTPVVKNIALSAELQKLLDIDDNKMKQLEDILNEYNRKASIVITNKSLQHLQRKSQLEELKASRDQKMQAILTESQVKIFLEEARRSLEPLRNKRNIQKTN